MKNLELVYNAIPNCRGSEIKDKQEFGKFFKALTSLNVRILAQVLTRTNRNGLLPSDKSKHMAFKHSDWLETNYCMRIQNHLFTLLSEEPLVIT